MGANYQQFDESGNITSSTRPEDAQSQNNGILSDAKNNSQNPSLSYDLGDFDRENEDQVREMQKFLGSKDYDLGYTGLDKRGGIEFWGDKSENALSQYSGTFEEANDDVISTTGEPVGDGSDSEDATSLISEDNKVIENSEAIEDPSQGGGEETLVSTSNTGGEKKSPLEGLQNVLGQAWGAFKESGYKGMDAKVFNGHLPFGPKPYDVYQQKNNTVDGSAETAITESNEAVTTADGKEDPKKSPWESFKWQSPQYGNYK